MTAITVGKTAPFNTKERIKDIPHTVKEQTAKAFTKSIDAITKTWNKLPKAVRFTLGFMGFIGLVFAWCFACAYAVFGLLGYNVATLILYYMIAMGVPFGIMMSLEG